MGLIRWAVILRRSNGRYVKKLDGPCSKYSAKKLALYWETKYDETYQVLVEKMVNPK